MTQGMLEAITGAMGESDNEIGGFLLTRLTADATTGQTTIDVESTLNWPDSGHIGIQNVKYAYTGRTDQQFSGLTAQVNGVAVTGLLADYDKQTLVTDLNRQFSALDLIRRAVFINTAEADDLDILGRNLGVKRLPFIDNDDVFREVIQAIAYTPRGTIYALELALDALLGSGNYQIKEDALNNPNVVTIVIDATAGLKDEEIGQFYLNSPECYLPTTLTTIDVGDEPLGVGSVRLKGYDFETDLTALPSLFTITEYSGDPGWAPWIYGGISEAAGVTVLPGGGIAINEPGTTSIYVGEYRGTEQSHVHLHMTFRALSTQPLASVIPTECILEILAQTRSLKFGCFANDAQTFNAQMLDASNNPVGPVTVLSYDDYHHVTLAITRYNYVLIIDGSVVYSVPKSSWSTGFPLNILQWGADPTGAFNTYMEIKSLDLFVENPEEFWDANSSLIASAALPTRIRTNSTMNFSAADIGKRIDVVGSLLQNPQGGTNDGRYVITSIVDTERVEVEGLAGVNALLNSAQPTRIIVQTSDAFTFPDDLGKTITITGSTLGNDGTYTIGTLLDPDTLVDLSTFQTPEIGKQTNACEVTSATFVSESGLAWQLLPVFITESLAGLITLHDAGDITGSILTLRKSLPTFAFFPWPSVVCVDESVVHSGQLLSPDLLNELISESPLLFEYYPIYLADPFGYLRYYVDLLTAAGVIPEFIVE
jgi:hypothetical protein